MIFTYITQTCKWYNLINFCTVRTEIAFNFPFPPPFFVNVIVGCSSGVSELQFDSIKPGASRGAQELSTHPFLQGDVMAYSMVAVIKCPGKGNLNNKGFVWFTTQGLHEKCPPGAPVLEHVVSSQLANKPVLP